MLVALLVGRGRSSDGWGGGGVPSGVAIEDPLEAPTCLCSASSPLAVGGGVGAIVRTRASSSLSGDGEDDYLALVVSFARFRRDP